MRPTNLYISPYTFDIKYLDCHDNGLCDFQRQLIELNDRLAPDVLRVTLLHEVVHALLRNIKLDEDVEEQVCDAVSEGVYALLQDNTITEWLMGTDDDH